jgi:oxygen-independent coproporphyrinogen-3 oxidase
VRIAFPQYDVKTGRAEHEYSHRIILQACIVGKEMYLTGSIQVDGEITKDTQVCHLNGDAASSASGRWMARIFTYRLLCQHCRTNLNEYGVLTGVRPTKLVHRMLDRGWEQARIWEELQRKYLITPARARLLTEVAYNNRPYVEGTGLNHMISIYIGIPICPSRCFYCSFPGAILQSYERQVQPYVKALLQEMDDIGNAIKELGLAVQSIYIGGGTPTVLADRDLDDLFRLMHQKYVSNATREVTLEAGRPDTLSLARMQMFKQAGISRICINPQTMNDTTLKRMGRKHGSAEVITAVEWARQAGINIVNMDLIVGLPGESRHDYQATISQVLNLRPENITLHTLAAKKGSDLARTEGVNWKKENPVKDGLQLMQEALRAQGYEPYYLYRQKYMRTDAENTGFSLPGHYGLFNILMIEERQTIIGVGGGAATKLINSSGKITSVYNPSDPDSYCKAVPELVRRKVDNLRALN